MAFILAMEFSACSWIKKDIESRVLASLRERVEAGGSGISVDSLVFKGREGKVFPGHIFISLGIEIEKDSVRIQDDIAQLHYEFPQPGRLLSQALR